MDDSADFIVAADDRVDRAISCPRGEVLAVFFEGSERVFWVLVGDAVRATHVAQCTQHFLGAHTEPLMSGEQ